jgi:hypothetical protein
MEFRRDLVREREADRTTVYVDEYEMRAVEQIAQITGEVGTSSNQPILVSRRNQFDGRNEAPVPLDVNGRFRVEGGHGDFFVRFDGIGAGFTCRRFGLDHRFVGGPGAHAHVGGSRGAPTAINGAKPM